MQSTVSEEFLPVQGYGGAYEVSNLGRVRSTDRYRSDDDYPLTGRMMRQVNTGDGRKGVTLYIDGLGTRYLVHRLVLTTFVGPCPEGSEACHGDGDPTNNRLDNLRWGTHLENEADKKRHGTHHNRIKTHCPRGHILAEPNLAVGELVRGHRKCRACNVARAAAQKHGTPFSEAVANAKFERIMNAA